MTEIALSTTVVAEKQTALCTTPIVKNAVNIHKPRLTNSITKRAQMTKDSAAELTSILGTNIHTRAVVLVGTRRQNRSIL